MFVGGMTYVVDKDVGEGLAASCKYVGDKFVDPDVCLCAIDVCPQRTKPKEPLVEEFPPDGR